MSFFWAVKQFEQLSAKEYHDILQLRMKVFVVEQNLNYQDVDGYDEDSVHIWGSDSLGKVIAYIRILKPHHVYKDGLLWSQARIGRVVVAPEYRKEKLGKALMEKAMSYIREHYQGKDVILNAQTYLIKFYKSFGFKEVGEFFVEEGIPHCQMVYSSEGIKS